MYLCVDSQRLAVAKLQFCKMQEPMSVSTAQLPGEFRFYRKLGMGGESGKTVLQSVLEFGVEIILLTHLLVLFVIICVFLKIIFLSLALPYFGFVASSLVHSILPPLRNGTDSQYLSSKLTISHCAPPIRISV